MKRDSETSRMPGKALLLGKSELGSAAHDAKGHANLDPAAEASLVAADWHRSTESLILACTRIKDAFVTFGTDQALLKAFIAGLVDGHVLSTAEARLGRAAPKLTKLIKIGEHADLLRRKQISPFLVPSYTTIYQLVVLAEKLPKDEQGINELVRIMAKCPDELTREYLIEETRRLKRTRSMAKDLTAARIKSEPVTEQKSSNLTQSGEQFDLLLLTPKQKDLAFLRADYADGSTLERCLPLLRLIDHSAAVVIVTRISDLPVIANILLPICGFPRPSRVLLVRRPTSLDVTDAEVLVMAERGEMRLSPPEDWLVDGKETIDAPAIAARLYPAASRKAHVFAPAQMDGWRRLGWVEEPSVR